MATLLAIEVFNFLSARQHARLFSVGCIKTHRVQRHSVPLASEYDFTLRQLAAQSQCFVDVRSRVNALQPIGQQRPQTGVRQAKQVGQARQGVVR